MPHAAAEDLHPVLALAETHFALVAPALDVDFERRFGEREVGRPEPHLHLIDLEERLAELLQDPFEMAEVTLFVDHEALDLMKHRRMRLVGIAAIGTTGTA